MFHPQHAYAAVAAYQRFIAMTDGQSLTSPVAHCNPNDPRVLGSDTFVAKLIGDAWRPQSRQTLTNLISDACRQYSVSHDTLISGSRQRHLTYVRSWIAHQANTQRIASLSEVARILNHTEGALRQSVKLHFNYP